MGMTELGVSIYNTSDMSPKLISENRRARFDYEILDTVEAGIELKGYEVKAAKSGRLELAGSYAVVRHGEAELLNAQIPPYQPKNTPPEYDPARTRRLLLHKEEIATLIGKLKEKGTILAPLEAHLKNGKIKLTLGFGRSKKRADKREAIKKRDIEREIGRRL